ncbi:MAG: hypothetical protein AAF653_21030, partial [Chloroflexota bacterium]
MARIAILIGPHTSFRNVSFQLAHCLELAGHEVIITSDTDCTTASRQESLSFAHLNPDGDDTPPKTEGIVSKLLQYPGRLLAYQQRRNKALKTRLEKLSRLDQFIEAHRPDVLLVDVEENDYIIAAHARDLRFALLSNFIGLHKAPGLPPTHTAIVPGHGWSGSSIGIEWAWLVYRVT